MSEAQRKTYPASFKAKVGLEAIRWVKTANEIGQEHGGHPVQVGRWQKEILEQPGPERLYRECGRLKMARDWLKKSPG